MQKLPRSAWITKMHGAALAAGVGSCGGGAAAAVGAAAAAFMDINTTASANAMDL